MIKVQPRCVLKPDHPTMSREVAVLKSQPSHVELIPAMKELLPSVANVRNLHDTAVLWRVRERRARAVVVEFQVHPISVTIPGTTERWDRN